jgi:hypothetical protein
MRNLLLVSVVGVVALGCGNQMLGEDSGPVGTANFALSETDYKLVSSFDVLRNGTDSKGILEAAVDAGASQVMTLPIGQYELDLIDADFDEVLPAFTADPGIPPSGPYCVYTGPNGATLGPLTGCTVASYNPDPFVIQADSNTDVDIEVTFHFDEDITVLFSTGRATFHLAPSDEQYCGTEGVVCDANEVCTMFDGTGPACVRMCATAAECEVGQSCILTDVLGSDGTGPGAKGLCR